MELSTTFTMEQVFALFCLHNSKAAGIGSLSDCDTKYIDYFKFNVSIPEF